MSLSTTGVNFDNLFFFKKIEEFFKQLRNVSQKKKLSKTSGGVFLFSVFSLLKNEKKTKQKKNEKKLKTANYKQKPKTKNYLYF